jgi:SAM-dependent methyltransferase
MNWSAESWKELHRTGYFLSHPHYRGQRPNNGTIVTELRDLANLRRTDVVLEIGCGYGRLMKPIAGCVAEVHGIEVSPEPLVMAQKLLAGVSNAVVTLCDGLSIPYQDDSFDLVYAVAVFQHLPRAVVRAYVPEIRRVLRPGGRCCLEFVRDPTNPVRDILPSMEGEHSTTWEPDEVAALFEGAKIVEHGPKTGPQSLALVWTKEGTQA